MSKLVPLLDRPFTRDGPAACEWFAILQVADMKGLYMVSGATSGDGVMARRRQIIEKGLCTKSDTVTEERDTVVWLGISHGSHYPANSS